MPQPKYQPMLEGHDIAYLRQILSKPVRSDHVDYYRKCALMAAAVGDLLHPISPRSAGAAFLIADIANSRARDSLGQSCRVV